MTDRGRVDVSVTIVTRNRASVLGHCLRALTDQSLDPSLYEIVIVDDGSTDETSAVIAAAQREARCEIRAFRFPEHRGVSAARNLSIREAHGAIIVFVDSDGLVPPSFLAVHLAAHRESQRHVICRGPIIATDSLRHPFAARWSLLDLNTSFFDTSNASVRREDLLRAGLFDELLFHWEGLDMGLRLRRLGLRRVYRANAPLYHYLLPVAAESLAALLLKEEDRARSARRFFALHATLEARLITSQTPLHRWLNGLQRGFGVVHAGNLVTWIERCRRWRIPAVGRVLMGGVLTERYLSHLHLLQRDTPTQPPAGLTPDRAQRPHDNDR
jgi:glycosyltransferase involved in cell wall biosynthesis